MSKLLGRLTRQVKLVIKILQMGSDAAYYVDIAQKNVCRSIEFLGNDNKIEQIF